MLTTSVSPALYRLAGQSIRLEPAIPEMHSFRIESQSLPPLPLRANLSELHGSTPSLQAKGWIAYQAQSLLGPPLVLALASHRLAGRLFDHPLQTDLAATHD